MGLREVFHFKAFRPLIFSSFLRRSKISSSLMLVISDEAPPSPSMAQSGVSPFLIHSRTASDINFLTSALMGTFSYSFLGLDSVNRFKLWITMIFVLDEKSFTFFMFIPFCSLISKLFYTFFCAILQCVR